MKYLREFVIGSSFIPIFGGMLNKALPKNIKSMQNDLIKDKDPFSIEEKTFKFKGNEFNYNQWIVIFPIWMGIWNVISFIIAKKYNLTLRMRLFIISIISALAQITLVYFLNVYKLKESSWIKYSISRIIIYLVNWNILVYFLENNI